MKTHFGKGRFVLFALAPLVVLPLILYPNIMDAHHPEVAYTAAVALLMALWWMSEVIPLAVTSLVPVAAFPLLGIMNGKHVASQYFNHIIFLFIGGFLVALAMEKWNLHRRIALRILMTTGTTPAKILLGFMLATAFLSMWISNTATTMMMVPILLSIMTKMSEFQKTKTAEQIEKSVLLGIAYAASIGGIATLIGTPPNPLFVRIFKIHFPQGPEISFARWMLFALPLSVVLLVVAYVYLYGVFLRKHSFQYANKEIIRDEYRAMGPMRYEEKWVFGLFVTLALLWLFRKPIDVGKVHIPGWSELFAHPSWITDGNVAMFIGILLFLIPARDKTRGYFLMDWKTAERIPWGIILLFGGGFALAAGFKESGLSAWIGERLTGLQHVHPLFILLIITTTITFLTELTSNTATVETFLPVLAAMAVAMKVNPLFLMVPATIAGSFAFMLPVATPPNAIVFGTGKLRISDMIRAGIWMNLVGIVVLTLTAYFYMRWIFDIDFNSLPVWAH